MKISNEELNQDHLIQFVTKLYNQLGTALLQMNQSLKVKLTLAEWLHEYYNTYKLKSVSKSHLNQIRVCIQLHICDAIKEIPINLIAPYDIEKALAQVNTDRNRETTYMVLHEAFKIALENNFILCNPMTNVVKVKHVRKNGSALTQPEIALLLAKADHNYRNYFAFLLYTGCRKNEALSMTWNDIDFTNDIIHVRGTKTKDSDRCLPLFPQIKNYLDPNEHNSEYIFDQISYDRSSKLFHKILPNHKLHDARHTFSTRCIECGISMKVLQGWLGHARIETTSKIYTHILPDYMQSEARKFKLFK